MEMSLFQVAASFVIFLTLFCAQINAFDKMYNHREVTCRKLAQQLTTQESNENDAQFFKQCIVDYFGFKMTHTSIHHVPSIKATHFLDSGEKRPYMNLIAKRVERFFIRNGNWYKILQKKDIFHRNSKTCTNLLYVVAAKYTYALYVLNILRDQLTCRECIETKRPFGLSSYAMTNRESMCYIKPSSLTCAENIELNLLGHKSGSLTTLFNQFFKEPIGEDRTVPGFKEDSDILMGVRVSAFNLENVLPTMFTGPDLHYNIMLFHIAREMKASINMRLLSVVVAIFRMKTHSGNYFNELLSDQSPLRAKTSLARAFQQWSVELTSFESKIKSFMQSPHYNYELNYRRRHNIAFELVIGKLENSDVPSSWVSFLAEHAMCLIYNAQVYLTPGAVRHSVIEQKYIPKTRISLLIPKLEDYWQSMLENWANANRVYRKECFENKYRIRPCLLRMSKSLYLMLDAMSKVRPMFKTMGERLDYVEDVLRITKSWVINYRNKGYIRLPTLAPVQSAAPRPWLKRPFSMTSQPSDDFPEWPESEKEFPKTANIPVAEPPDKNIEGSIDLHKKKPLAKNVEDSKKANQLDKDIEGSMDTHVNKPLDKDNIGTLNTELLTEDVEGTYKTKPLDKDFEGFDTKSLTEDPAGALTNDVEGLQKPKPLDKNDMPAGLQEEEIQTDKIDGKSSGIYKTSPLTPEFLDLAETEEPDIFIKYVTLQEVKPLYVDVDTPTESPVRRTLPEDTMEKPLDDDEDTAGASSVEPESEKNMKYGTTSIEESLDKNNKKTAGSSMANPMDMNDNTQMDSTKEKPLDNDMKETAGSPISKPLDKDTKDAAGSPMRKLLDKDTKEIAGSQMGKLLNQDSAGSSIPKPLDNNIKETAGSQMEKSLGNDVKEANGSPITKPPNNDVKETAGTQVEEEAMQDDFPEYPASDVPVIPKKTAQKKLGTNNTHPRYLIRYYRRRRNGYTTAMSRRRRRTGIYASRRRRSLYLTRRRRSIRKLKNTDNRAPDETQNIQRFLSKFNCHFGANIGMMVLSEGCMDKIQLHVRKYNRAAFSHVAQLYGRPRPIHSGKRRDNVLVKTEL